MHAQSSVTARQDRSSVRWHAAILLAADRKLPALVINASERSLKLTCAQRCVAGTALRLEIGVPEPDNHSRLHRVTLDAKVSYEVVRGTEFLLALQIVAIDDAGLSRIREALLSHR